MKVKYFICAIGILALATGLGAQMGMGSKALDMSGVWHPVVGTGAVYEKTEKQGMKTTYELSVLSKEDVNGKDGYWVEIALPNERSGGMVYAKTLYYMEDKRIGVSRLIVQMPGMDAMEMDSGSPMGPARMAPAPPPDVRDKNELVGTESVTVPAGTFTCEHYRAKDGTGNVWISDKVSPLSIVKGVDSGSTWVLTKVLTESKEHITGPVKKFDPAEMMRHAR